MNKRSDVFAIRRKFIQKRIIGSESWSEEYDLNNICKKLLTESKVNGVYLTSSHCTPFEFSETAKNYCDYLFGEGDYSSDNSKYDLANFSNQVISCSTNPGTQSVRTLSGLPTPTDSPQQRNIDMPAKCNVSSPMLFSNSRENTPDSGKNFKRKGQRLRASINNTVNIKLNRMANGAVSKSPSPLSADIPIFVVNPPATDAKQFGPKSHSGEAIDKEPVSIIKNDNKTSECILNMINEFDNVKFGSDIIQKVKKHSDLNEDNELVLDITDNENTIPVNIEIAESCLSENSSDDKPKILLLETLVNPPAQKYICNDIVISYPQDTCQKYIEIDLSKTTETVIKVEESEIIPIVKTGRSDTNKTLDIIQEDQNFATIDAQKSQLGLNLDTENLSLDQVLNMMSTIPLENKNIIINATFTGSDVFAKALAASLSPLISDFLSSKLQLEDKKPQFHETSTESQPDVITRADVFHEDIKNEIIGDEEKPFDFSNEFKPFKNNAENLQYVNDGLDEIAHLPASEYAKDAAIPNDCIIKEVIPHTEPKSNSMICSCFPSRKRKN